MDGPEAAISTNTAHNTPFVPKRPSRYYPGVPSDSPTSLEDRVDSLEKRLEKAEQLLHIAEDMNKLHQELDEIRNAEISRKLEDLDQRIKKMESAQAEVVFECEGKIKQTISAMERGLILTLENREEESKSIKSRLEESSKPTKEIQERIQSMEKDNNERLSALLSTLEEVTKVTKKTEYQLSEWRESLKQVEGEQVHLLLLAREQEDRQLQVLSLQEDVESLRKAQEEVVEYLKGQPLDATADVEEAFLNDI